MTSSIFGEDEVVIQLNTTDDGNGSAVDSMEQEHQEAGEEDDDTSPARETRAVSSSVELGRRLLAAARDGDTAAVLDLMAKGAPFTSDWLGTSPLHLAASNNQAEMCAVLLRAGVSRDARTKVDRTPLHLAAYGGHEEAAKTLLEHGAQVDCRDMLGMTPLAWAAERGHAAVGRLLLQGGADPRALSKFRLTPRDLAAQTTPALINDMDLAEATRAQDQKTPETKTDKTETKINGGGQSGLAAGAGCSTRAARMLRRHGITLLPPDTGCTLLAAINSGRTLHLSETGRLMLKESVAEAKAALNQPTPTSNTNVTNLSNVTKVANLTNMANVSNVTKLTNLTNLSTGKTVTTPKPVKMITINKQKQNSNITIKKIISSNDQVRYVALPNNTRLLPVRNASIATPTSAPVIAPTAQPTPIITNTTPNNLADLSSFNNVTSTEDGVVRVPEQFLKSTDPEYLRARLLQAVAALTKTRKELAKYKSMSS